MTKETSTSKSAPRTRIARVATSTEAIEDATSTKPDAPYLNESHMFLRRIAQDARKAEHTIADLDADIQRFEAEIAARKSRREDLQLIVDAADAMLGGGKSPPSDTKRALEDDR